MAKLLTYYFLLLSFFGSAQVLLPGYKNGNWWIIRSDTTIALPKSFTSLSLFDTKGFILFEDEKNQGILDSNGRILYQSENQEITSLGNGLFSFHLDKKEWLLDMETGDTLCKSLHKPHLINDNYLHYYENKDTILLHVPTRKKWTLHGEIYPFLKYYHSVVFRVDSLNTFLFDPKGNMILLDSIDKSSRFVLPYVMDDKQFVLTPIRHLEFPFSTANVYIQEPYLSYYDGKLAHLLDLEQDKEIVSVPYETIYPYAEEGYIVKLKNKQGLLNKSFVLKIPVVYDQIFSTGNHFYVSKGGLQELMDRNYKLRIPCEFSQIRNDSNFFYTTNDLKLAGLYTTQYKQILPTMFDRIIVKDRLIKAYKGNKLRIIKLDIHDQLLSDIILDNAITAKQRLIDQTFNFDKRLLPLGWFYDRTPVFDTIGILTKYITKWGLKVNDSIISSPKFYNPIFVPDASFSRVNSSGLEFNLINIKFSVQRTSRLINYTNGKFADNQNYLRFSETDGYRRAFYRSSTTSGHQINRKNGEIEKVNFISSSYNRLVPYAIGGIPELVKHSNEAIPFGEWLPFNPWECGLLEGEKYYKLYEKSIELKDAKWNFLDTNGTDKYEDSFTFAKDFFRGTAIVKRATGWGVVDEDKEIVPCEFSDIQRVKLWNDTVFIVKKSSKMYQFLDSNLTQVAIDYSRVNKQKNEMALLSSRTDNAMFYQGEEIRDELKNSRLINDNFWVVKEKKEYVILDPEAVEICRTLNKPKRVLSTEFIVVESKGKQAVIRSSGDTIINFGIKEIVEYPYYYLVKTKEETNLYDREFQLIQKQKPRQKILPNSVNQLFAVIQKKNIKQYNSEGEFIAKTRHPFAQDIKLFHHQYFIADHFLIEDTFEIKLEKTDDLEIHSDGTVQLQRGKTKNEFYKETLSKPQIEVNSKRANYLGSGVVRFIIDGKQYIKSIENEIELPLNATLEGKFSNGMCMFALDKRFLYINENLEIVVNKRLQEAKPFENGMAAVKLNGAWTLMSVDGKFKSYPSYASITPISTNFFQTTDLPKYGLFDSHGNEIIPPIYEKIIFVTSEIIQVVLKGDMGYIDIKGNSIFSIK